MSFPDEGKGAPSAADGKLPAKARKSNRSTLPSTAPHFEREFFRTAALFLFARLECTEHPRLETGLGELDARSELLAILDEWRGARR